MEDPSFKLKEQAQLVCTELFNLGENSMFLSVNAANQTSTILGSSQGMIFLQSRLDIIEQFYKYCSGEQISVDLKSLKKDISTMTDETIGNFSLYKQPEIQSKLALVDTSSSTREQKEETSRKEICDISPTENKDVKNPLTPDRRIMDNDITSFSRNVEPEEQMNDDFMQSDSDNSDCGENLPHQTEKNEYQETETCDQDSKRKRTPPEVLQDTEHSNKSKSNNTDISADENKQEILNSGYIKPRKVKQHIPNEPTFDIYISGKMLFKGVAQVKQDCLKKSVNKDSNLKASKKNGYILDFSDLEEQEIAVVKPGIAKSSNHANPKFSSKTLVFDRDSDGKHICPECGKKFTDKHALICHIRYHTNERPYKCEICGKTYKQRNHLREHKFSHRPDYRPHLCDICGKGFNLPSKLKTHKKIHQNLPPVKCEDCGKTFARIELLRQHIAFKKSGYDFMCELCGRKFRQNDLLKKHMVTNHSNGPQHQCPYCDKKFFTKKNFNVHVNNHLGIYKYKCDCCNIGFSCSSALLRHYKRKAGELGKRKPKHKKDSQIKSQQKMEEYLAEDREINLVWD